MQFLVHPVWNPVAPPSLRELLPATSTQHLVHPHDPCLRWSPSVVPTGWPPGLPPLRTDYTSHSLAHTKSKLSLSHFQVSLSLSLLSVFIYCLNLLNRVLISLLNSLSGGSSRSFLLGAYAG